MTKLGSWKLHICPKVTKPGSVIGHKIDYKWVRLWEGSSTNPAKVNPSTPPGGKDERGKSCWSSKSEVTLEGLPLFGFNFLLVGLYTQGVPSLILREGYRKVGPFPSFSDPNKACRTPLLPPGLWWRQTRRVRLWVIEHPACITFLVCLLFACVDWMF